MCAGRQKAEQERRIGSRRLLIAGKLAGKQTHRLLERLEDRPQDGQIDIKRIIVAASQLLYLVVMFHRGGCSCYLQQRHSTWHRHTQINSTSLQTITFQMCVGLEPEDKFQKHKTCDTITQEL